MAEKKLPERPKGTVLDNKLIVEINKELTAIRLVLQRSLKDEQQAASQRPTAIKKPRIVEKAAEKLKQITESVKSTFGNVKEKQTTGVKNVASDFLTSVPALGAVGLGAALVFSQPLRDFIWGFLKQTFNMATGILPEPLQDFIKLFTSGEAVEKTQTVINEFQAAGDLAEETNKEFEGDEQAFETQSNKIKSEAIKAEKALSKTQDQDVEKEQVVQPPSPIEPYPAAAQEGSEARPEPREPSVSVARPTPVPQPAPQTQAVTPTQPVEQAKPVEIKKPPSPSFQQGKRVMLSAMDSEGIRNPIARAQILAQTAHESGGFKYTQELGNAAYFQKYEGRRDLGNIFPGDGIKYIGRGFLQTTGRVNYQQFKDEFGVDVINNPETLADAQFAAKSALFWFKKNARKVEKLSGGDWSNTTGITRAVNGGLNGLDDRMKYFEFFKTDPDVVGQPVQEKTEPSQGTQLAQASQQVVSEKKQETARKRVSTRSILLAQQQTTIVPA